MSPLLAERRAESLTALRQYGLIATAVQPLALEGGGVLEEVRLCYESWGRLNETRSNAILICHALTGDAHAAGRYTATDRKPGWWDEAIGPGKAIDTDRYFVLCSNVLGGCQGSTGPSSINPATGEAWGADFPAVTVRDMVRAQARLLEQLGIERLHAVIGGSLGAMQALEWGATFPERVERVVAIGGAGRFHPQGIALNEVQRQAILHDPAYQGGRYYGTPGPVHGLATARMLGMITYRSDPSMWAQFGREQRPGAPAVARPEEVAFQVESYLHHQGQRLVERFDANSYLYLTRAMDLMDLGRGRESYEGAHALIRARVLAVGIASDLLFPPYLQRETVELVRAAGGDASYIEMSSIWGHDAFLVDWGEIAGRVRSFLG